MNLLDHYRKLWFFNLNRFKGENYQLMREYFAQVFIGEVEEFMPLAGKKVLDVGGARGEFSSVISRQRTCEAVNIDRRPKSAIWPNTVRASADALPCSDKQFDLVICRNVLEHIPSERQQPSVDELYRVTRSNGFCYIVIPPWYNPHAGHGLKPFHVLPFKAAKFLRQLVFGSKITANSWSEANLYPITFRTMRRMILSSGFRIVATRDTHFRLHFLTRLPLIREIAVPAVAFILARE